MFNNYAIFYNWKSKQSIMKALSEIIIEHDFNDARKKLEEKTIKSLSVLKKRLKEL